MIVKPLEIPLIIYKLQALLRRLDPLHPKRLDIEDSLRRYQSGYKGEASIDYHLGFLPEKGVYILHSLRLPDFKQRYFQIDIVILTTKFILILEIKNLAGTLTFDPPNHQLIQSTNDKEYVYEDPVIQVQRHQQLIASFIASNHLPRIPIIPLVVVSHPSGIIKFTDNDKRYQQSIIRSNVIPGKYESIDAAYKDICFTDKECRKLERLLLKNDCPLDPDVLDKFKINPSDIINGVLCPRCPFACMTRSHGTWECGICGYCCKDAHVQAFEDHALLYGKNITNTQARRFLGVDSPSAVAKYLSKLNCNYSGENKGRVYELSYFLKK